MANKRARAAKTSDAEPPALQCHPLAILLHTVRRMVEVDRQIARRTSGPDTLRTAKGELLAFARQAHFASAVLVNLLEWSKDYQPLGD